MTINLQLSNEMTSRNDLDFIGQDVYNLIIGIANAFIYFLLHAAVELVEWDKLAQVRN